MLCKRGEIEDIRKYHLKWIGQRKFDGVRCKATCRDGFVQLDGRGTTNLTPIFSEIVEELKGLNGVFDGEICCDTFGHTQSRVHTQNQLKRNLLRKSYPAKFYIFDFICDEVYLKRMLMLRKIIRWENRFDYEHLEIVDGDFDLVNLWETAKKEKWEGVIIKNPKSYYQEKRSFDWLKVKFEKTKDLVFTSYSENPAGIRIESDDGIAIQVSGSNSYLVKDKIDAFGKCKVEVRYLNETINNKLRMPVYSKMK